MVIVTDIYSAGESPLGKITGQQVAEAISDYHQQVYYQPSLELVSAFLHKVLRPGIWQYFSVLVTSIKLFQRL